MWLVYQPTDKGLAIPETTQKEIANELFATEYGEHQKRRVSTGTLKAFSIEAVRPEMVEPAFDLAMQEVGKSIEIFLCQRPETIAIQRELLKALLRFVA